MTHHYLQWPLDSANSIKRKRAGLSLSRDQIALNGSVSLATGTKEKELFLIDGATHIETYWKPEYVKVAVNKLESFFGKYLK